MSRNGIVWVAVAAMAAVLTIAAPTASARSFDDVLRFNGIQYRATRHEGGRPLTAADLGRHFDTMKCDSRESPGGVVCPDDGSALLPPGTPVHTVEGYRPEFRLAVQQDGEVRLYQVVNNPRAKKGADLFDIAGRVASVEVRREDTRTLHSVRMIMHPQNRRTLVDPPEVDALVGVVLRAAVDHRLQMEWQDRNFRYWITFHLRDGTALGGAYFPSNGWFRGGVVLAPEFRQAIEDLFAFRDQ